jgi:hypothetical protein
MAKKASEPQLKSAQLSEQQAIAAVPKIERRLAELRSLDIRTLSNDNGDNVLNSLAQKINATLRDVFGLNTVEYNEYQVESLSAFPMIFTSDTDTSVRARLPFIRLALPPL